VSRLPNFGIIAALLRAQWLSTRLFRGRGSVFSWAIGAVWYGVWTVLALVVQDLTASASSQQLERGLAPTLFFVFAYWQLSPLVSASLGTSLDFRKLLVYPISHNTLFAAEVSLRLTTGAEMLLILCGLAIGLLRSGELAGVSAPRILIALGGFTAFNLLLSAGLRNLLERLLGRRYVRETVVLGIVMLTTLPRLILASGMRLGRLRDVLSATTYAAWPWAAASGWALGRGPVVSALILSGWLTAVYLFSRRQFERTLQYDAQAARANENALAGQVRWTETLSHLLSRCLPEPISPLVQKELHTIGRSPRFRMVFLMGCSFSLLVWLPLVLGRGRSGTVAAHFLALVAAYSLTMLGQVSYWNAFGFDRAAAQLYFCMPVPFAAVLAAKNIASMVFILLEVAAIAGVSYLFRAPVTLQAVWEAFLVTLVAALYMFAVGNLSSVYYPRPIDPDRVSQGGAASRFQVLLFFLYPLALLPVGLAYLARYAFASPAAFYLVLAFAAAIGAGIYRIALDSAVAAAASRREEMLTALTTGAGPILSD